MRKVFDNKNRLQKILDVEAALVRAHAEVGNIPSYAAEEISRKASVRYVKPEEVREIKKKIKHGIMAIVYVLSNVCEEGAGGYIHLGASSNDISDTALALQLKEAVEIILKDLEDVEELLLSLKFILFAEEVQRSIDRIKECRKRLLVGKMSGAVGTQAAFGDKGLEIQKIVMKQLGLKSLTVSNQVIQRDRHAEFIADLGILAGTLEKIGKGIQDEIGEVDGLLGGLIFSKRACNLARVVRSKVGAALESISLEHEGDLTSLPYEQIVIPEVCLLIDEMLKSMKESLQGSNLRAPN